MNPSTHRSCLWVALAVAGLALDRADAELPTLPDKPWGDYFAVQTSRKWDFVMDSWGLGKLITTGDSGKAAGQNLHIPVTFVIEEILAGGKTVTKTVDHASLETADKPVWKQGKATFRGKVVGGASFEAHVEFNKGEVLLGGRILDPGTLTRNPLRFGVRAVFPSAYRSAKKSDKDAAKKFAKRLKDDRYTLVRTDGKRATFEGGDKVGPEAVDVNGPGVAEFRAEIDAYQGRKFQFKAPVGSGMLLWNRQDQELHEGFSVTWYPDPAKDPDGKTSLSIDVR